MNLNWCANGFLVQYPLENNRCSLCKRLVGRMKDGRVKRHVWQTKNGSAKTRSENSQANLAARAFFERGRK